MTEATDAQVVERLTDRQQAMVLDNIALVYTVAKRYGGIPFPEYEDLISRLKLRLCVAVARYDPARGLKISSYLVHSLEGECKNHFRDEVWTVRPPRKLRENWSAVNAAFRDSDGGHLGGEDPQVIASCAYPTPLHQPVSLDGEATETLVDRIADPQVNVEAAVVARYGADRVLRQLFSWLAPPERYALALSMAGHGRLRFERRYRVTPPQARAIWAALLPKVRRAWFTLLEGDRLPENPGCEILTAINAAKAAARESALPENVAARRRERQRVKTADRSPPAKSG